MRLSPFAAGMALGVFMAIMLLATTLLSVRTGYGRAFLEIFVSIYPGYKITPAGAFAGFGYGFVDGYISGALVAWLYNLFLGKKE